MLTGLSSAQARALFAKYGPNEIEEQRANAFMRFAIAFTAPVSVMLIAASVLSLAIGKTFDGYFIAMLFALNVGISFWHEHKADRALEELRRTLEIRARVLRDGSWQMIESRFIVPGDTVECSVGNLVPADMRIDEANNLEVNEAVLTGESMPKQKHAGGTAYAGSVVSSGLLRGEVTATGSQAFFGKIAHMGANTKRQSTMERDILSISKFLIVAALVAVVILTAVFLYLGRSLGDTLLLDVSLLIAGIPISLPTVMSLIVSLGAVSLAQKKALTRRLAALEDFANVTLLLTDKTGTLTQNKVTVERTHAYAPFSEDELRKLAACAAIPTKTSMIDGAILRAGEAAMRGMQPIIESFTPADSIRKRSTTLFQIGADRYLVSAGTPPVIQKFAKTGAVDALSRDIEAASTEGARVVAVAVKKNPSGLDDERDMVLAGIMVISDPLRDDAAETLAFLKKEGVNTIMVTGDTRATAAHVAEKLGLTGPVLSAAETDITAIPANKLGETAVFAEVLPAHKLALVEHAEQSYTVAMAGDGVNDLPAVRRADVGIAVANAVDALKGTADIVLLSPGINVLMTALIEARKIFFRLYNYSVYRISESFRLVATALVLGLIIKDFPLTPVQIILLAFLNDIPIITLAFDRVKRTDPADLNPRERFVLGTLYGLVGVANSVLFYFLLAYGLHLPLVSIQTAFFLKLTVSGHMLIYVAHARDRWWQFLPAWSVIIATTATQALATVLALGGLFIAPISLALVAFTWGWAFFWMQISEWMKHFGIRAHTMVPISAKATI